MIRDGQELARIRQQWQTVQAFKTSSHRQYLIPGSGYINETPLDEHYNLPLVLAYSVLGEVLDILIEQRTLKLKKPPKPRPKGAPRRVGMKDKMRDASKEPALDWCGDNFKVVDEGRCARDKLAHQAKLVSKNDCLRYIDAIGKQLAAWHIIGAPTE